MQDKAEGTQRPASRTRKAARKWVMKMADHPERHRAGLERWLHGHPERIASYNQVARELRVATYCSARLNLPREAARPSHRISPFRRHPVLAAAIASLCILAGSFVYLNVFTSQTTGGKIAAVHGRQAQQSYRTGVGEVRRIPLPDGSTVTLDTASAFDFRFTSGQRTIALRYGRARFAVAHDAQRPFLVLAGGGSIRATGTVFDVDIRDDVRVHLISGAVEITLPSRGATSRPPAIPLQQGQQVAFGPGSAGKAISPEPGPLSEAQWVTGMMSFEDEPLSRIIAEANRYAQVRIVVANSQVLSQKMFVELDIRQTEQVARKLAILLDLDVDRSESGTLVLRAR